MNIVFTILGLIVALVAVYAYYGGSKKIEFSIVETGGEVLIYEEIQGDYRQSREVGDKIYYSLLDEDKIETFKGFGVYYDNPQKIEQSKLRSEAGCILEEKDIDKLSYLENKYTIRTFPRKEYITTEFPYKGKMSVLIGVMRVIPTLTKYATENGYGDGAVMEIYDVPNHIILYRKEIISD